MSTLIVPWNCFAISHPFTQLPAAPRACPLPASPPVALHTSPGPDELPKRAHLELIPQASWLGLVRWATAGSWPRWKVQLCVTGQCGADHQADDRRDGRCPRRGAWRGVLSADADAAVQRARRPPSGQAVRSCRPGSFGSRRGRCVADCPWVFPRASDLAKRCRETRIGARGFEPTRRPYLLPV